MTLTDIRAVADVCHERGVELAVDNTFMSPYFQRPIELGADIVMHSTTKFLNGHSDGLGGVLVGTKPEHKENFAFVQKCTGGILSPFECWMILRGVKTLAVRMRQHDASGRKIAEYLAQSHESQKVFYPGLASHPQHELAKRQMSGFGALISFETGSLENANAMLQAGEGLHAGRIPWRRRDADLSSGDHDPCGDRRGGARQARHHRWPGAHLGRH